MAIFGRQKTGLQAISEFNVKYVKFSEKLGVGTLYSLDKKDNKSGAKASNLTDYPAVGIITEGSAGSFGEGYEDQPNRPLAMYEGENVNAFYQLDLGVETFTDDEVAKRIPIYEGVDGAWTKTKPVASGARVREIGFPINKAVIFFDFTRPAGVKNV